MAAARGATALAALHAALRPDVLARPADGGRASSPPASGPPSSRVGAISASSGLRIAAFAILVGGVALLLRARPRALRRRIAPIGALIEAAAQIERGDYSARVPERGGREVRALARTFNTMSARLSAIDSQRRSFLADVAHELRTPLVDHARPARGDARRHPSRATTTTCARSSRTPSRSSGSSATSRRSRRPRRARCPCTSSRSTSRCSRTPSPTTSPRRRARRA